MREPAATFPPDRGRSRSVDFAHPFDRSMYLRLETRLHQRRDELEEIRTKSTRFQLTYLHLQTDIDRLSHRIDKMPEVPFFFRPQFDSIDPSRFRFPIICSSIWTRIIRHFSICRAT